MEDLSHGLYVPKMHVSEGFPVLSPDVLAGFSDKAVTDEAARAICLAPEAPEEVPDGE